MKLSLGNHGLNLITKTNLLNKSVIVTVISRSIREEAAMIKYIHKLAFFEAETRKYKFKSIKVILT